MVLHHHIYEVLFAFSLAGVTDGLIKIAAKGANTIAFVKILFNIILPPF